MKISDFKNKKITIMGLGLHGGGVGAAEFFAKAGARVLVTDLRKKDQLQASIDKLKGLKIKFALGQHRPEDFVGADLIIKNPAVSENSKYLEMARKNKVEIDSDMGVFFEICKNKKIAVTGTKGKSTVTKLIFKLTRQKYKNAVLAGNIRASVLAATKKIVPKNPVVLELSSWQLHDLGKHKKSPAIAAVTNILNDHQNRYKSFNDYIRDKQNILRFQKKEDWAILNFDDLVVKDFEKMTEAQIFFFSIKEDLREKTEPEKIGVFLKDDFLVFGPEAEKIISVNEVPLLGKHNLANVAAAATVGRTIGLKNKEIKKVIQKFEGLPGRLEKIAWNKKRIAFNDTAATTPDATAASLEALAEKYPNKPITLITGGTDKKLDFRELARKIKALFDAGNLENIVLLPGDATEKIKNDLKEISFDLTPNNVVEVFNMSDAVKLGTALMDSRGIILLSPAAASFGLFLHEFDRGEKFNAAIDKYFT